MERFATHHSEYKSVNLTKFPWKKNGIETSGNEELGFILS